VSSSNSDKPAQPQSNDKPPLLDRLAGTLVGRGWRWLRAQERDSWFHAPLIEPPATAPAPKPTRKPRRGAPVQPAQTSTEPLFEDWRLDLTPALKKQIKSEVTLRLPDHAQPSAAQWKMIFSTTPSTCVVAGAGAGKSTSLVLRVLVLHHYLGYELDSLSVVTFTRESRRDFIKKLCQVFDIWGFSYQFEKLREVVRTYHSLILPMVQALPEHAQVRAFENLGADGAAAAEANPFDLRLNDTQRQLMNHCYRDLVVAEPEFAAQIAKLKLQAATLRKLDAENPDVQKRVKALGLASKRDIELCDIIEAQWTAKGQWPIKGIKNVRQPIDIKGFTFHAHGYLPKLDAWVVLGHDPSADPEARRPGSKIPLWGEWAVKRTLFQAFCDKPLIWLDNVSEAKQLLSAVGTRAVTGPGFDYQPNGELAPAPLLDCFVAAASFIENLGLQVPDAITAMELTEQDDDHAFFAALKLYWPALEMTLGQQSPPVMTFNRMFSLFGESSSEQLRTLPDDVLRPMSHLMVDEFQDISPQIVSWLRASLGEILRRGSALAGDRAARHSSLLCVGDDWQSIYGWRGSAPKYFIDFNKTFPAHASTRVMLGENYRSHQHIIDAAEHIVASVPTLPGKRAVACGTQAEAPVPVTVLTRDLADLARRASEHYHAGDSLLLLYRKSTDRQALAEHIQGLILADQALPTEQRRIKQLTYHSAKGLQADAVFLLGDCQHQTRSPYKNRIYALAGLGQPGETEGYDRAQHEEALRLAYVGITRAVRHCYWYVEAKARPGAKASDLVDGRKPFFSDLRIKA